jgi:hypothetical protein
MKRFLYFYCWALVYAMAIVSADQFLMGHWRYTVFGVAGAVMWIAGYEAHTREQVNFNRHGRSR